MSETEMLRVGSMNNDERAIIGLLSPAERKDILVLAAQAKQQQMDKRLMWAQLERIRSGELVPVLTMKQKEIEMEELNEATAHALLGSQDIVIRSIKPIDQATLGKEEWDQIRGPNALVGNADVYGAWLVTWTPTRYTNAPYPGQVMVVKSISPLTGEPAFMTVPARGRVPTYFER